MTTRSTVFRTAATVAVLLSLTLLNGCSDASVAAEGAGGMPPALVDVMTVQPQTVPLLLQSPALLAGSREVEIRARVSGILQTRNFNEGAKVTSGQSLFSLDAAPYLAAVNRNKAELAAAQARLEKAELDLQRTIIRAPVDGIVTNKQVQIGQRIAVMEAALDGVQRGRRQCAQYAGIAQMFGDRQGAGPGAGDVRERDGFRTGRHDHAAGLALDAVDVDPRLARIRSHRCRSAVAPTLCRPDAARNRQMDRRIGSAFGDVLFRPTGEGAESRVLRLPQPKQCLWRATF